MQLLAKGGFDLTRRMRTDSGVKVEGVFMSRIGWLVLLAMVVACTDDARGSTEDTEAIMGGDADGQMDEQPAGDGDGDGDGTAGAGMEDDPDVDVNGDGDGDGDGPGNGAVDAMMSMEPPALPDFDLGNPDDDGDDIAPELMAPYFAAQCRLRIRCNYTAMTQEECEAPNDLPCTEIRGAYAPKADDIAACAEALDAVSCEDEDAPIPAPCIRINAALDGVELVETGEACGGLPPRVCPPTDFCVPEDPMCLMGVCKTAPVASEPCFRDNCGPGLLCDPASNTCVEPDPVLAGEGERCVQQLPCDEGLYCDAANTCRPQVARGEPCEGHAQCALDMLCVAGTCGYLAVSCDAAEVGQPCTEFGGCAEGAACVRTGLCEAAPGAGEACRGLGDLCEMSTFCLPADDGRAFQCMEPRAPGESCTSGEQCAVGECVRCPPEEECEAGKCSSDLAQPCMTDEDCFSKNCIGGGCAFPVGDSCEW